ncbi:acetyl-CoA synthetase-like protein [Exidia glandulosa HHB12029]|uniref:Acetyl-CoA synthetase-like protein n=1 Tax=Exidia glandulosa HHB12029 TaxID=1314781 RepID=A0A165EG19_EXIGL|nr:acetyl-CoA synthetase-like protein [Exidia glandulosa HHB12029]
MTGYTFKPAHTLAECDAILTAPGALLETERVVVDGIIIRSFKNLPPSLRSFWLDCVQLYGPKPYILFEKQRTSYAEVHERASRLACVLRTKYGIRKGDRVAIGMRNCTEWVIAFWACHLLGAVSAQVNAWLPAQPFLHCLALVSAKLVIVDPERAKLIAALPQPGRVLVAAADGGAPVQGKPFKVPRGMSSFDGEIDKYSGPLDAWRQEPECKLDDNATIFFTSGTTGMPKAVLSTHRAFQHGWAGSIYGRDRMLLRRGMKPWGRGDPKATSAILNGVPLFHVTGCTNTFMGYSWQGFTMAFLRKWDKDAAAELMQREKITSFVGVPSQVNQLMDTPLAGRPFIQQISWGGAPAPSNIIANSHKLFPGALLAQGYGMTETSAAVVAFGADDYMMRPKSTGTTYPVNEIVIMDTSAEPERQCAVGVTGEVWVRGANVMKGYWKDPEETKKVLTRDGWLKTGDLGYVDEEGFLYLVDRGAW